MALAAGEDVVFNLPVHSTTARANAQLERDVLHWLNGLRAEQHLLPLRANASIQNVARAYGLDMFGHGYLSHVSRDGRTLQTRLAATGLRFQVVGENLAYAGEVDEAERALWHSEPHRRNMLYPAFRLVGVAVIDGGGDGVIIVQDFSDDPATDSTAASRRLVPSGVLSSRP